MGRTEKNVLCVLVIMFSVLLMGEMTLLNMIMLVISAHIFVNIAPIKNADRNLWFMVLTTLFFLPYNVALTRASSRSLNFLCDGPVSSTLVLLIVFLFIFSMEEIVFGIMHQCLNQI